MAEAQAVLEQLVPRDRRGNQAGTTTRVVSMRRKRPKGSKR